jgi:hypothetical protein
VVEEGSREAILEAMMFVFVVVGNSMESFQCQKGRMGPQERVGCFSFVVLSELGGEAIQTRNLGIEVSFFLKRIKTKRLLIQETRD